MGNNLSYIVERLYPIRSEERLEELRRLLLDQELSSSLIKDSKAAELSILLQPSKHEDPRLASLRHLKVDPLIWRPDKETIERWSANISTFWTSPTWTARFDDGQLAYVYDSYFNLANRQGEDILRIRFSILFFYDLLCFLYPQHSRRAPASIYESFAKIIKDHSSRGDSLKAITTMVSDLIGRGRRYNKLTETFGDGVIVELPVDVSRYVVETRLPLEDEGIYNKVVKGIADLNLNKKAEENGSNELAKKIRKSVLIPFHFLRESPITYTHRRPETKTVSSNHKAQSYETKDRPSPHSTNPQQSATASLDELQPTTHDIGQQFGTKQSNMQQVLKRSHDPAVDALILLRNSPKQSAKRTRANPSRADQLSDATSYYIVASNPDSSNTVNGFGEDNGASAAQLPQQDQLQGESPIQTMSPDQITLTSTVQRVKISTKGPAAPAITTGRRNALSQPSLDQAYDTSIGAISGISDLNPHHPSSDSSPSVVQDIFPASGGSSEANSHNRATCDSVVSPVLSDTQSAFRFQRNPLNPNTGWENTGVSALGYQWDLLDPNTGWENTGVSALGSQWDLLDPNMTGAFVLNGTYWISTRDGRITELMLPVSNGNH